MKLESTVGVGTHLTIIIYLAKDSAGLSAK
jgi:hypothetical protein